MAAPRAKKKKLFVIVVVILTIAQTNLNNSITDSIEECLGCLLAKSLSIFDGDEEGENWTVDQQAVYDAAEAVADAYESETEVDLSFLAGELQEALNNL